MANGSTWSEISDETLAERARARSMPAFVELVRRYEARLFNFVLRRVGLAADAEDLTQETFLRAWRSIDRYKPGKRLSTWLFTIAARLAVDHLRAREMRRNKIQDCVSMSSRHANELDDDARFEGARLWRLAAELLNEEQHSALWLRYAENLSIKEIAGVLSRTRISVRVMLHRARETLAAHSKTAPNPCVKTKALEVVQGVTLDGGVACSTT